MIMTLVCLEMLDQLVSGYSYMEDKHRRDTPSGTEMATGESSGMFTPSSRSDFQSKMEVRFHKKCEKSEQPVGQQLEQPYEKTWQDKSKMDESENSLASEWTELTGTLHE
ncbi:hypothetical protein Acr_10g0006010 [Actinidia rufa]|uniref:Uncharacterized protein n=1 Tax=Actinidia rufa TaxID=165716 RepID=A0A7J0F9V3_9ERIC|nr:hypothetical protein Acr_10g0006010 [Actinidia rufa]